MDVENLAKELILKNMTPEQQMAVLDSVRSSVAQAKEVQKRKIGENVDLVVQALKKIESDITTRFESVGNSIEKRVLSIKDGRDGADGKNGRDGKDGKSGKDGLKGDKGDSGQDGRDGVDGVDGVSVVNANIDFDGSLIISLSDGREINVGEVVSADIAEKIKVINTMSTNAAIAVKEEGTTLTSGVKSINFVGTGITATTSGDDVTVTVAGGGGSGTVTSVAATAGTGISVSGSPITTSGTLTITNTAPDQTVVLTAGTGINTSGTYPSFTVTNSAPDQTVSLTASTGITTSGTYPSFTIANSAPDQTVVLTAGTGINTSGTYPNFTITNSAPDQTVSLTGAGTTSISGSYPSFTITSNDAFIGTVTSVSGTSPVSVATGTTTPVISLASNYGDTQNPYASKTANYVLAAPDGSAGAPTFRAIVAADIPTLNQNTTGTASNVTGTVAIANGGTGQTTRQEAMDALAGAVTSGSYLRGNGTDVVMSTIQAADVPTLNQNTTGTASNVTGTVAVANGGTGITSFGTGVATWLGTPSSANLASAITDETGSGSLVFGTSPTLTTPNIDSAQVATVSGTAPLYMCRAWVNFNGAANTNLSGTYTRTSPSTTLTVTATAHGLIVGSSVNLDFTTGTGLDGIYTVVTVADANTFTVTTVASTTTSGNVTLLRNTIRASGNVSSITDNGTGDYTVNFTTAMPDANYSAVCGGSLTDVDTRFLGTLTYLTTSVKVESGGLSAGAYSSTDALNISVAIFR